MAQKNRIEVSFDDYTTNNYATLDEASAEILEKHACNVAVDRVAEVDATTGEEVQVYGCTWSVTLEPLE